MNKGIALPMVKIGDKTINMLNICYWEELRGLNGNQLIEIVYPGPTRCCLDAAESAQFREYMAKSQAAAQSSIIPASNVLIG